MVANNLKPNNPGGEPPRDAVDWKTKLRPDSRQRIVNKMMETLRRQLPLSGHQGLQELKNIAARFEEMVYTDAISQRDYECKISLKMLSLENKSRNTMPNALPANSAGNSNRLPDAGASHSLQPQVQNMVQSHPIPLSGNQFQAHQQLLYQNIQNIMASSGVQSSAGLASAIPPVSGIPQTPMASVVGQNNGMQNIPSISQSSAGNQMGQAVPSNVFSNSLRQMEGRKQDVLQPQLPESQNSQYLYQQQLQQLSKLKFQQGNLSQPLRPSHIQWQQQQQNLLQPNQLQSCQQQQGVQTSSVMQPSMMPSTSISGLPQNQPSSLQQSTSSMLQQHQQTVPRKQLLPQQEAQMMKRSLLPSKQQHPMGQQSNTANMQQSQSISQQNSMGDMQQQQRQHSLQNNLQNLQQQELLAQQNDLSTMQQLGPQNNVVLQQQQQLLGSQSGNPGMLVNQHSIQMLQQAKLPMQQQSQQDGTNLLVTQGQQSQSQPSPQQLMSQMQSPPTQLRQQLSLQQQQPPVQHDLQQRLQASGQATSSLLQSQSVIDQQKQLSRSQRTLLDTSSTSLDAAAQTGQANGVDWQEEVYQKIKQMKNAYLPEMTEMYHKVAAKVQQQDSMPQPKSDQLDELKLFKGMVERAIRLLQITKSSITPAFKENLGTYEKHILSIVSKNRLGKQVSSMRKGLPQPHMQSLHQSQSQVFQVQPHENHVNPQLQSMDLQGSTPTMSQNSMSNLQHNSLTSISGDMMNALHPGSSMDSGQGGSLQLVAVGSLQQNPVSTFQRSSISYLSTSSGMSMPQPNIRIHSNSNMLQHQHLEQQQEQQMLQSQHVKQQTQQCQMQQLMQKQQQQQLPAQMQTQQILQLHQMNDAYEMKIPRGMGVKPGVFQQHLPTDQHSSHPHQQMKSGTSFPVSSPQLLQAASPQLLQQSSPQVDQQNLLPSLTKTGTPLQSANSPFVVPSPQTPLAPSPLLGYSEKPVSGISSLSNVGHQQTLAAPAPASASSLAIGTPGIPASPLLAEFTGLDGACGGTLTTTSGKSNVMEQPLERLLKVKPLSPKALSSAASDIGSVVSMVDSIAGSNPVNGSRAAIGEDLVAMTKCRLQARNCVTQDGMGGTRKMKHYTNAMPLNVVSSVCSISDSFKQLAFSETSDLELTATSGVKRRKIEVSHVLMEEIREINQQLIDTVVDISQEDVDPTVAAAAAAEGGEGTVVKCSFSAVALSPNLKSHYASAQLSPIQPVRLLVPVNYPNRSPILVDKLPVEVSKEYEDLSAKAMSRFCISLRSLSQPASLREIAKTWDACARAIISEYAQQSGGGSFSSKYGTWENCLSAA